MAILFVFALFIDNGIHLHASHDEKEEMGIRNQTINMISSDRIHNGSLKRIPMSVKAQDLANHKARQAYKIVAKQPKQSKYYVHNLSSNGHNKFQQSPLSKKLNYHNKVHQYKYNENCAEISFGRRYYRNPGYHFQPYHIVRTTWSLANLTNAHFMRYDQSKKNVHRNNILNHRNRDLGVSVIYNSKTNHGVLVEEFKRK